jgi:hypothetical protein
MYIELFIEKKREKERKHFSGHLLSVLKKTNFYITAIN